MYFSQDFPDAELAEVMSNTQILGALEPNKLQHLRGDVSCNQNKHPERNGDVKQTRRTYSIYGLGLV
jgi:hypothetical protein